jgi:hypothetical protein
MPKPRGREHTSLTETATLVVRELKKVPRIKMIAPGEIKTGSKRGGKRFVTAVETTAGLELLISGQSVQRVAVHTPSPTRVYEQLKNAKSLRDFAFSYRERKPGV